MIKNFEIEVHNVPEDSDKYIVARLVNNQLWYWGSWNAENEAEKAAASLENGLVVIG